MHTNRALWRAYGWTLYPTILHAKWASLFAMSGWAYCSAPSVLIEGHQPAFLIRIPCGHSECIGNWNISYHEVNVFLPPIPERIIEAAETAWTTPIGLFDARGPAHAKWLMSHGAGGGWFDVVSWFHDAENRWLESSLVLKQYVEGVPYFDPYHLIPPASAKVGLLWQDMPKPMKPSASADILPFEPPTPSNTPPSSITPAWAQDHQDE